jgi:hypothetical protein
MRRFRILTNRAKLHCSDVRHQMLELIHYGSVVVADGRIERDRRMRASRGVGGRAVTVGRASAPGLEARRALMLHDWPVVIDLITLTLNHGVFAVLAASSLAEVEAILPEGGPQLAVVDMDHADSTTLTCHRAFERGTVRDEGRPPWPPAVGWR